MKLWNHQQEAIDLFSLKRSFALFFEMGCVSGETELRLNRCGKGFRIKIKDAYIRFNNLFPEKTTRGKPYLRKGWDRSKPTYSRSLVGNEIRLQEIGEIIYSGKQLVYELELENGKKLKATADHPIKTVDGYTELLKLGIGQEVLTNGKFVKLGENNSNYKTGKTIDKDGYVRLNGIYNHPNSNKYGRIQEHRHLMSNHLGRALEAHELVHHIDGNKQNNSIENLKIVTNETHHLEHNWGKNLKVSRWGDTLVAERSKVKSITEVGIEDTYDVHMKGKHHNFVANGIVVHNTGKTLTAIQSYNQILNSHKLNNLTLFHHSIVFCPSIMLETWKREFNRFAPDTHVIVLEGSGKQRLQQFQLGQRSNGPIVFVTNIESLSIKILADEMKQTKFTLSIFDESHKLKNPKGIRAKAAHSIADNSKRVLILTGSPVLNSYEDLWSQFRLLSRDIVGENFYAWQKRWFVNINLGKHWVKFPTYRPNKEAVPYLQGLMATYAMTVKKSEVLDLPPLVKQTAYVDLSKDLIKHYKEMEKDFVTLFKGDVCVSELIVTKMLRLQQMTAGLVQGEEDANVVHTEKMDALSELLSDLCPTHKVIVWCNWKNPLQQIKKLCDSIGLYWCSIEGGQSNKDRQEQVDLFNNELKYNVCIANQQAGGVGIGLQAASYMVYFSKGFSLEQDVQSESRAHRGGSEHHESITRIDLLTRGTIDEDIHEALDAKLTMAQMVERFKEKYGR